MAVIPLQPPIEWGYDDATGELVVRLRERPPPDDPDPANFVPENEYVVRLVVASYVKRPL